jgi:hypothetical protein
MKRMKWIGLAAGVVILLVSFHSGAEGKGKSPGAKTMAPGAPAALKLVIVPDGFKLSWKLSPEDPGTVTGYEIVRAELASGPFTKVGAVGKGVSEYVDKTAAKEIIYYYKVRAAAGDVYSPYSNTVTGER